MCSNILSAHQTDRLSRVLCTGYEAVERCRKEKKPKYWQLWRMRTRILYCTLKKTGTRSRNRSENHTEEVNSFCERRPRWNVRTFHPSRRADTSIRISAALSRTLAVVLQVSGSRGCIWSYNCNFMTGAFEITRHDSFCDLSFVQHIVRLLLVCWGKQHQQHLGLKDTKYIGKKGIITAEMDRQRWCSCDRPPLTLWRRNYFFLISAHSVYKMWIIQEPKKLALWNKLHFEEKKNGEYRACLKYSVPTFVE